MTERTPQQARADAVAALRAGYAPRPDIPGLERTPVGTPHNTDNHGEAEAQAHTDLAAAFSSPDIQALERRASSYRPEDDAKIEHLQRLGAAGFLTAQLRTSLGYLESARDAAEQLKATGHPDTEH